jgi:hypothetical protein
VFGFLVVVVVVVVLTYEKALTGNAKEDIRDMESIPSIII